MHRTLKAETTCPPSAMMRAQQRRFDRLRAELNEVQSHEVLDMRTSVALYQPLPRSMPERLPPPAYADRFEVRYLSANGGNHWNSAWVNVSTTCIAEHVGLKKIDDGVSKVCFGALLLARLLEREKKIEDAYMFATAQSSSECRASTLSKQ